MLCSVQYTPCQIQHIYMYLDLLCVICWLNVNGHRRWVDSVNFTAHGKSPFSWVSSIPVDATVWCHQDWPGICFFGTKLHQPRWRNPDDSLTLLFINSTRTSHDWAVTLSIMKSYCVSYSILQIAPMYSVCVYVWACMHVCVCVPDINMQVGNTCVPVSSYAFTLHDWELSLN